MADLKTTNIYGDAYINNKVGIATNAPATRLQIGQLSPTAATEGIQFGDDTGARIYRDSAGIIKVAGGFTSTNYILAGNYLQTAGNLIYPASQTATQRLEVGNASGNAWVTGIAIAQGGNVTVYNNLTVNNAATVTNDLTVNGNTYLGNANNDTVYVNDTIRIGATDSGDASLFFGEGAVAGSDYGARWYWDSGYTFTWYTRNNGTDTALFDYVTNDLNYINWRRHFHMQNKEINYSSQVHFNAGTRFVGNDTQYLIFRSDSTGVGGIQIQDGGITTKGYVGYWDSGGGGILNNTGNWSLRYNFGNANSGGTLYGAWVVNGNISATNLSGTNTGDQTVGNGTITIAAGTGVGVGSSNTFTTNQSGATTVTISNSGVTSLTTNTGLSSNVTATGAVTVTNTGVTSNVAGTGISVSGATGAVTITNSSPNATHTGDVTGATALTIANDAVTTVKILNANVTNAKLANSSLTIGSTAISLGATATTIAGLTSVTSTTFVGALTGNAATATNVAWSGITSKPTTLSGFGITDAASINGASNQNFSANSIYPYEWIRFMVDAGIYWQSGTYAGWHIHPQATWGMSFRSNAATECGLQLRRSDATSLGAVYADGTSIGFLTAAFGWGASFTVAGTMNRGTVPLGRIETITAYTILGNNNASAAAVPSALTPAQVATMLSGQTMNIAGSSTSCTGNAATATSAGCINSDTGNVGGNRLQYWQVSGNTTLNPDGEWYNAIRMGHGDPVTYYGNTLAIRMTGGNLGDIYTRTLTNGTQGSWNRFWHNNNDGAGSGLDADLVDGKGLATAGTADTIVLRDGSGHIYGQYILGSYFNASAGNSENPTIGQIWTQNTTDTYLRKSTPAHFRSQVTDGSYPSLTGANASGTWSISISGNAATATTATNVTIANGSVTLAKIENITAYTILGNSNASAAATPAALSVATVATMLSGQTMNINGSSTSCSGNAATATLATKASTLSQGGGNGTGMTFNWSGQGGQPTWLWGSNDGTNIYVWNPSNFNVNYATSAGSATSATTAGSCSGNAASATNATTAGGLAVQSGTNYDANKIVRTDGNGYILAGWINTISGDNGTTAIDRVYASNDGYIRYYTPANFRTVLDVPTRNGSGVTNFGINTAPSNRLHINGDNANPSIRVDNGAVVLAASAASNSKTFYGWLPISIAGTTKWIQMYN